MLEPPLLQRPHGAQHFVRVGPHLEVVADPEPAHDARSIEHDRRGPRHVLAVLAAARVHEPVAPPSRSATVRASAVHAYQRRPSATASPARVAAMAKAAT